MKLLMTILALLLIPFPVQSVPTLVPPSGSFSASQVILSGASTLPSNGNRTFTFSSKVRPSSQLILHASITPTITTVEHNMVTSSANSISYPGISRGFTNIPTLTTLTGTSTSSLNSLTVSFTSQPFPINGSSSLNFSNFSQPSRSVTSSRLARPQVSASSPSYIPLNGSFPLTHTNATISLTSYPQVSAKPSAILRNNTFMPLLTKTSSSRISTISMYNATFSSNLTSGSSSYTAHPQVSSTALASAVLNGTYTFSHHNLSLDDSLSSSLRVAAAEDDHPRVVFAHFMVSNVPHWSVDNWKADIRLAQQAHIDAFALNIAAGDDNNAKSVNKAFEAADALGFKLAFSFDYAGGGPWDINDVMGFLIEYKFRTSYLRHQGLAFVSTFEGPESAQDWITIKILIGVFFMPDWSSKGAKEAMQLAGGIADGLFSWAAWPWGNTDMNTYVDASYIEFLDGKPYMMPVSPWFFTNLPGFDKNWVWRGDDLWFDRWHEVNVVDPPFVQIISWNDYGESHYIGPLDANGYEAFERGDAPYNYALDMPHDGWRHFLPFVIDTYKTKGTSITKEGLVIWYRLHPAAACSTGGTTGSTASQLLIEFEPAAVSQDMIFFTALLGSDAEVFVSIGGVYIDASFKHKANGFGGLYHGHIATNGRTGPVVVRVVRLNRIVVEVVGETITTSCENGIQNWNAWVGSADAAGTIPTRTPALIKNQVCVSGTGVGIFAEICAFTCKYGYCPLGACQCLELGNVVKNPPSTGIIGYPAPGMSSSFDGLCNFACNLGFCPSQNCGTTKVPPTNPTSSQFLPPSCTAGTGGGFFAGLCSFSCNFGFCPIGACTCTQTGVLILPPGENLDKLGYFLHEGGDHGLCKFACTHGWCPGDVCDSVSSDEEIEEVDYYADPSTWDALCTGKYESLDFIEADLEQIPSYCLNMYIAQAEANILGQAISDYKAILRSGYDGKFKTYSSYIKSLVRPSLISFMEGPGRKYFTCTETQRQTCCNDCQNAQCWTECDHDDPCTKRGDLKPAVCPTYVPDIADLTAPPEFHYTLHDEEGFFNELASMYGIEKSWVKFGDLTVHARAGCQGGPVTEGCFVKWSDFPIEGIVNVLDPKELLTKSIAELETFQGRLIKAAEQEGNNLYSQSTDDVTDAATIPVFMTVEAVTAMQAVVDTAEKVEEDELTQSILLFFTSFLMVVPAVGSGVAGLGFTTIGRMITLTGAAADAALGIFGIVEDPESAIFLLFAALIGSRDFTKAASHRRAMTGKDLDALGANVAASTRKVDNIKTRGMCRL